MWLFVDSQDFPCLPVEWGITQIDLILNQPFIPELTLSGFTVSPVLSIYVFGLLIFHYGFHVEYMLLSLSANLWM